jgi:hypothetical protein
MAICTVANVNEDVGALLGDPSLEKYTAAVQLPFFRMAYQTVWDVAMNYDLQMVKSEATYTLPANTTSLTPATAIISNMGEPERLWERAVGETDYLAMFPKDDFTNVTISDRLLFWKWESDTFYFIGATQDRQLKIEYSASSAAPTTGNIPIDNCRLLLALLTAMRIADAPVCGQPQRAASLRADAFGPAMTPDGSGGALRLFTNPMVKEMQKRPVTPSRFRSRRTWRGQ